jgi:hypothetical protein
MLDSFVRRTRRAARRRIAITVENATYCALSNVCTSNAFLAGLDAFASAQRTPERRKTP